MLAVNSPCINVCTVFDGICIGCGRTTEELIKWKKMTDEQKLKVLERLKTFVRQPRWNETGELPENPAETP